MGNLIWETDPLGIAPDPVTWTPENGNTVTEHTTFYDYDDIDRLIKLTQPDPDGNTGTDDQPIYHYGYDKAGNLIWATDPSGQAPNPVSGDPDEEYTTFYEYDNLQRLTKATQPDPDYDGDDSNQPVYHYGYDAMGNLLWETDPLGNAPVAGIPDGIHTTFYTYDRLGRLNNIVSPDPDGTDVNTLPSYVTSYIYDTLGNLYMELDTVGHVTSYEYDNLGQLISETLPDPDLESYQNGPLPAAKTTYSYDVSGNLLSVTDAKANAGEYGPDAFSDDKLVAYWKLDGDFDLGVYTESDPPPTLSGTPAWEDGRFGGAISFCDDGIIEDTDHVDINDLEEINFASGEYNTVSFWMKWDGSEYQIPFSWGGSTTHCAYCLLFKNDSFGFNTGHGGDLFGITSSSDELKDRWVHVVAVFCNGNALNNTLYIDGQKMTLEPNGDPTSRFMNNTARLSGWYGSGDLQFGGLIDDLCIYKGELTAPEVAALLGTTRYEYDSLGRMVKEIGSPIDNGDGTFNYPTVVYEYDTAGNVTSVTDELGHVTVYAYDKLNRLIQTSLPDPDGSGGPDNPPIYYYGYDKAGNLLWETDPLGIAPDPGTGEPENGNVVTEHTTFYRYDALHRQTHVLDALSNNDPTNPTHATVTEYDKAGNVTSIEDAEENTTRFQYDRINRLIIETDPLGATRTYTYDEAGRFVELLDRNNRITTYDYDAIHRLTEEKWYDAGDVPGTNDPTNIITTEYDELGQTTEISDSTASYEYSYDHAGRVTHAVAALFASTETYAFDYRYDSLGNVTQIIDSFGGQTDYAYNPMGLLDWVSQSGTDVTGKSAEYEYKDNGQIETLTRRNNSLIGGPAAVVSTYEYDQLDRLEFLIHNDGVVSSPNLLAKYNYQYDIDSRIKDIVIDYTNAVYDFHRDYSYDNIDQLLSAEDGGPAIESYTYDENGNRDTANGVDYVPGDVNANRLKSDGMYYYTYDGEGNRTERFIWDDVGGNNDGIVDDNEKSSITEYEWDNRNRLIKVTERASVGAAASKIIDYIYDALDRRIATLVDSDADGYYTGVNDDCTYSLFQGDDLFLELTDTDGPGGADATLARRYLYGQAVDDLIAVEDEICNEVFLTLADHQGSVRDAVRYDDTAQTTTHVLHREFDSFGTFTSAYPDAGNGFNADTVVISQAFTGRLYDENTGLYDYRARWFDPITGNFISEDPISFAGGDANLYRYCSNSPANYIDPTGQSRLSRWLSDFGDAITHWFDEGTDALMHWYKEAEDAVDHWSDEVTQVYLNTIREIEDEHRAFWHNPASYLEDNWKDGDILRVASIAFAVWTYGPMLSQYLSSFSLPNGSFLPDSLFGNFDTWQFEPAGDVTPFMSTSTTTASTNSVIQASNETIIMFGPPEPFYYDLEPLYSTMDFGLDIGTSTLDIGSSTISTSSLSLGTNATSFVDFSWTLPGDLGIGPSLTFDLPSLTSTLLSGPANLASSMSTGLSNIASTLSTGFSSVTSTMSSLFGSGIGFFQSEGMRQFASTAATGATAGAAGGGLGWAGYEAYDSWQGRRQRQAAARNDNRVATEQPSNESPSSDQQTATHFYDDFLSISPQFAQSSANLTKTENAYKNAWFWQSSSRKDQYVEAAHGKELWQTRVEELRQRMVQSPGAAQKTIEALSLDLGRQSTVNASDIIASSTGFQNFMLEYQKPIQASMNARNLRGPVGGWESEGIAILKGGAKGTGRGVRNIAVGTAKGVKEMGLMAADFTNATVEIVSGYQLYRGDLSQGLQALTSGQVGYGQYYGEFGADIVTLGVYGQGKTLYQLGAGQITVDQASEQIGSTAVFQLGGAKLMQTQGVGTNPIRLPRLRAPSKIPHKNSLDYVGDTHVYRIKGPDGTYKIGESAQGVRVRDGASIRGEQQARRLTRETGDFYRSDIRKTFLDKRSARNYETKTIERFRRMFGDDALPGNKTNR